MSYYANLRTNMINMIALTLVVGFVLTTAQTMFADAKATNEHDYKYWWVYPDGKTFPCLGPL